ncbi:hypothetical protein [Saccharothrix longispora]|uniref:hypothetical protein n=1 Tax=Saccharothrix longispora TaxID=33920 RepID=UPI0028FDBCCC|nr:hypothetical protein [Saccharothrix longispora]MDU0288655.1 hypothetical protein [Saccharothrix longispora]
MRELSLALDVLRWAAGFYLRHWRWVAGLSLVASVQRLAVVGGWLPPGPALASEVLVAGVRIALVVLVWRVALRGERPDWPGARAFARRHWPSLGWHLVLMSAAALVFDVGLEAAGALLPEAWRQTYLAVLLFAKNPTVIAFTVLWWVGVVRQAAVSRPVPAGATPSGSGPRP